MTSKLLALLLVLLPAAAAMVAAGCGGGDNADAAAMPMAKFARRADLICSAASVEQAKGATAYLRRHPGAEEADLIEPAVIPPLEAMAKELKGLGLPSGHEAKAEAFLRQVEQALQAVKEDPKTALSEQNNPFEKANELGAELKLGDCSRNP